MYIYDKKQLFIELGKIEEAEPIEDMADLKKLLLLLSGDKRVADQITMTEIAMLFDDSYSLLNLYFDSLDDVFDCRKLNDIQISCRRAV